MTDGARRADHAPGWAGWIARVLAWTFILAVVAVVTVSVLIPRVAGATPYTILTGSMRPGLPPGTLVVVKPAPAGEIGVGTVITYQLASGRPTVVTHRVVSAGYTVEGKPIFRTQGDANNVADEKVVRPLQIKGALWYDVPYVGYANTYITGEERRITLIVVVSALLLYATWMFASAFRDRRVRRKVKQLT
jgi:signal peptidase